MLIIARNFNAPINGRARDRQVTQATLYKGPLLTVPNDLPEIERKAMYNILQLPFNN